MDITHDGHDQRLVIPGLQSFYTAVSDLWYPMLRLAGGGILLTHGWLKLESGAAPMVPYFAKLGLQPALPLAYFVIFLETVGAACVILGLFTRVFAAAIALELAVIVYLVKMPLGWGQMEFTLLWGLVMFAIALHGGGPYSLDRKIGREL
jgi:putative oxidoreductase